MHVLTSRSSTSGCRPRSPTKASAPPTCCGPASRHRGPGPVAVPQRRRTRSGCSNPSPAESATCSKTACPRSRCWSTRSSESSRANASWTRVSSPAWLAGPDWQNRSACSPLVSVTCSVSWPRDGRTCHRPAPLPQRKNRREQRSPDLRQARAQRHARRQSPRPRRAGLPSRVTQSMARRNPAGSGVSEQGRAGFVAEPTPRPVGIARRHRSAGCAPTGCAASR